MKQKNPKSINIQIQNCGKVNLDNINNINKKGVNEKEKLLTLSIQQINDGLLAIVFDTNNTKRNKEAASIAENLLGGKLVNSTMWVTIPDCMLLPSIVPLMHLYRYIQSWKSCKSYFRKKQINLYQFINALIHVKDCSENYIARNHTKYCWRSLNKNGWGCIHKFNQETP